MLFKHALCGRFLGQTVIVVKPIVVTSEIRILTRGLFSIIKFKKIEIIVMVCEGSLLLCTENIDQLYLSKDTSDKAIFHFLSKTCVNASAHQ